MKNAPYSLATDGSNDNGLKKMNPLTVQIYDVNLKRVKTSLLDMCLSSGSMAEKLFQGINDCLAGHRIPWENCIAFSVDNTNVNMGKNNSILTHVKQQNPSQIFINLNLFLQREEPLIGAINSSLKRFLKLLACKFISPVTVKASTSFQQLLDVEQYLPGMCVFLKSNFKKKLFITKTCCTAQGMCVINIL